MTDQDRNDPNNRDRMGDEPSRGGGSQGSERDRGDRDENQGDRQRRENPGRGDSGREEMPGDESRRELGHQGRNDGDDGECPERDDERGSMNLAELAGDLYETWNDAAFLYRKAEDLAGLTENDRKGDTIEEADEDRPGQKICERSQSQKASGDAQNAGEQGEHHRQRGVSRLVAGGKRRDARRDQRAGGRIGANDQLPRRAEDRIGDERQYARIKSHFRAEAGELGISDADRQGDRGHGKTCPEIGRRIVEPVAKQGGKAWGVAGERGHRLPLSGA